MINNPLPHTQLLSAFLAHWNQQDRLLRLSLNILALLATVQSPFLGLIKARFSETFRHLIAYSLRNAAP